MVAEKVELLAELLRPESISNRDGKKNSSQLIISKTPMETAGKYNCDLPSG